MKPNQFQEDFFDAVLSGEGHYVLRARAGTGKSTTIVEAVKRAPRSLRILICAFNKPIQIELEKKVKALGLTNVIAKTLHGLGYGCITRHLGRPKMDGDKLIKITRAYLEEVGCQYIAGRQAALLKLVGMAKNTLSYELPRLEALCYEYGIRDEDHPAPVLARQAQEIMDRCEQMAVDSQIIDFDDMIWIPARLALKPSHFDLVFVDEAQDLNAAQLWMIRQTIRTEESRLFAVGDDRQAIYAWRGAGHSVINDIIQEFDAEVLPLSETFRCPKLVVEEVSHIVPDYVAAETAPSGRVKTVGLAQMLSEVERGDYVLSRTNAPLLPICLQLISNGTPAKIEGRDIGRSLTALVKKSKAATIPELMTWLDKYEARERDRLLPDHAGAFDQTLDRIACIVALADGEEVVSEMVTKIEGLFADNTQNGSVCLSTVHKAKGKERKKVWMIAETFREGVSDEEDNIYYVACTRAQESLFFVQR